MTQGGLRAVVDPLLIWIGWFGLVLKLAGCAGRLP